MKNAPICEPHELQTDKFSHTSNAIPQPDALFALADLYKVFGDSTRLRILYVLLDAELCVCEIASLCGMTVSAISHQLRILKQARLVKHRKNGKSVLYSLADSHVHTVLAQGIEHILEPR